MKIIKTKFDGLLVIKRPTHYDNRGFLKELFEQKKFKKKFIFDYFSFSKKNVVRGLHIQTKKSQGKFVTVIKGKIFDVALDLRKKSKTFGKYFFLKLSEKNNISLLIPKGFAHGFCVLSNESVFHYKWSYPGNYPDVEDQFTIKWNDKNININWPISNPILSKRDK